jgi:type IV fimbrial biogenesis protein FimT
MQLIGRARRHTGFTLVELLIAMSLVAVLLALAAPSFSGWIRNSQVRTVAQALQSGVRLAQAEALRRNRQVVFFLTNATPGLSATASADGAYWVIRWIPLPGDTVTSTSPLFEPFVQGGKIADFANGVSITGPAAICFNAVGRRVAATATATGVTGATCTIDADEPVATYQLQRAGSDRPLRVLVALGGQVRMCDPARSLADDAPDGCP